MGKFLIFFLLFSGSIYAQELDSLASDTSSKAPPRHLIGVYLQLGVNQAPSPLGSSPISIFGGGIRYDRFDIEYFVSMFEDDYEKRLIFPNYFIFDYASGGGCVSYALLQSRLINGSPFLAIQWGDMVWKRSDTGEDFLRDKFTSNQIGVKLEGQLSKFVKPEVQIGYQWISEIGLPDLNKNKFTGFFCGFQRKIWIF